jgi:hypothetical protein
MLPRRSLALLSTALCATLFLIQVQAAPALAPATPPKYDNLTAPAPAAAASSYWLATIDRKNRIWGNEDASTAAAEGSYKIFRNVVKDYGADPTGATDATDAINKAIADGNRCGLATRECESSTVHPAIVFFPPGTYKVSKPIQMYYYTQMIGDATNKPVIQASPDFSGMAVLDSDPYDNGTNWYINQNNFFRQVRNFVMDLTLSDSAAGIHWQVAQATSLQNIDFKMVKGGNQQGIFMDNGSGGWMSDLTFEGGKFGAFLGSQQFTARNLYFKDVQTAIYVNWDWGWVFSNITIEGGNVGLDMAANPMNQSTGSVLLSDSKISGTQYGVNTSFSQTGNIPDVGNTLVLDNVDLSGVAVAGVWSAKDQKPILGKEKVESWAQGNGYDASGSQNRTVGALAAPKKDQSLLDSNGNIFARTKPQYQNYPLTSFVSAIAEGCAADGETDDTQAVQKFLDKVAATPGAIAYFDHGAYLIRDTIKIPQDIIITGEIWPLIVADGSADAFKDVNNPKPVWQVGDPSTNSTGAVEISDMIFQTKGPAPGAIMIEWNQNSAPGASGMWDSHIRIGGSYGTDLTSSNEECVGMPTTQPSDKCMGVFAMFHATPSSGNLLLENCWHWVADHDLEINNQTQISIFSARGDLFESQAGPVWLWGAASEHSVIYNYQISGVKSFFGGFMQTETPYFQPNPEVPQPFQPNEKYGDPTFENCGAAANSSVPCKDAWGMRIVDSDNVLIYAAGMYSFFNNYDQACVGEHNCQENMISIENSNVHMYTVTTKAAVNMIVDGSRKVQGSENRNVFGDTLAYYTSSRG